MRCWSYKGRFAGGSASLAADAKTLDEAPGGGGDGGAGGGGVPFT